MGRAEGGRGEGVVIADKIVREARSVRSARPCRSGDRCDWVVSGISGERDSLCRERS